MNCPPEIARVILQILHRGILVARSQGWGENAQRAALEADHVHNLPRLLSDFSQDKLEWYWKNEIPSYIKARQRLGHPENEFEYLWEELRRAAPMLTDNSTIK